MRWWVLFLLASCVSVVCADTEIIQHERHLERFLDACDLGCDVFLYSRDNPASLKAKKSALAQPGVPLAIVHAPDFERYRDHGTPQWIHMEARRRRRLQATNLFRYDQLAGRIPKDRDCKLLILGGVLKGTFLRHFMLEAEENPSVLHIYLETQPTHTTPQIAHLHKTFALMHLGRNDQTSIVTYKDGKVVSIEAYTDPKHYAKESAMRRR